MTSPSKRRPKPINPYATATKLDTAERDRMDAQMLRQTIPMVSRAINRLGGAGQLRVLDCGSGYASLGAHLASGNEVPAHISLLDVHEGLLECAIARSRDLGLKVDGHKLRIDAPGLPASLCGHDLVVASFCFLHASDLRAALRNTALALRPGGLLVVSDADYCNSIAQGAAANEVLEELRHKLHIRDLSNALPREAVAAGLSPISGISNSDRLDTYDGLDAKTEGLSFISNFHESDPAYTAWARMGELDSIHIRRISHVYTRRA